MNYKHKPKSRKLRCFSYRMSGVFSRESTGLL